MNASSRILPQKLGKYEVRREVGRGGLAKIMMRGGLSGMGLGSKQRFGR